MKNIIKKKYVIIVIGAVLVITITQFLFTHGSVSDEVTAKAVASLLARAAISERDLNAAMDIHGVRDVYVTHADGTVVLPARRSGDAAQMDGNATAIVALNENERIVVEAREGSQPPKMPLFLFVPFAVGCALFVAHKRSTARRNQDDGDRGDSDVVNDSIGIELASRLADAVLIRIDKGCRVVAASKRASGQCGVATSSGHIVDILRPEEVQNVLQLIRRCEREGSVAKDLAWRGSSLRVGVLKDGSGFLLKLSKELCDEVDA